MKGVMDIYLYVFDSLPDWQVAFALAGLGNPALQRRVGRFRVQTVARSRAPVTTVSGLRILPDLMLDQVGPQGSAMLILPGGDAWEAGGNAEAVETAIEFLWAGVPVAAICGATAGLARGGLLDDRRHTGNAAEHLRATGYQGAHLYQEGVAAVADRNVVTASALSSLEFASEIFKCLGHSDDGALAAWNGIFRMREARSMPTMMELAAAPPAPRPEAAPSSSPAQRLAR